LLKLGISSGWDGAGGGRGHATNGLGAWGLRVEKGSALVVDDEHNIVELLTDLLEGELGLQVLRAYDGLAALEAFERLRPDLVIADIMMPRLDGLTLARRLRDRFAARKIILMSAAVTPRTTEFAYIAKPFDISQMIELVSDMLHEPVDPGPIGGSNTGDAAGPPTS
jgi:CheY-like chemotaxis protein